MSRSLTTLIDVVINHAELAKLFDLYQVSFSTEKQQLSWGKKLSKIDKHTSPLGLISHGGKYWILLDKDAEAPKKLPDIGFVSSSFVDCDDLLITRLLTRALGKLSGEQVFSGLGETYLYLETDSFKKETVHKCVSVDIKESLRFDSMFIELKGTVFCPTEMVFKPQAVIEQAPKFSFDLTTGMLNRDKNGSLMINSPGKGKYTSNAIDISGQKPISLRKSRTGALHHYVSLMNKTFNKAFEMSLKQINADWRQHYGNAEIKAVYNKIYDVVNTTGGINIVNASLSEEGYRKLQNEEWPVKVNFIANDELNDKTPTLVVLDSKAEYETAGLEDKKQSFYGQNKVVQSTYNKTVITKDSKALKVLIDTWVKEIAIKLECKQNQFLIQEFNDYYWFVSVEQRYKNDPVTYHILKCTDGNFTYESGDEFYFDDLGIELPERQRYFEKIHYVIDMGSGEPKVCSIVHEGIAAVPDGAILFDILNQLEKSSVEGITRHYIDNFLSANSKSGDPLISRLKSLLETFPSKGEFYKDEIKKEGIQYRSNAEKSFFDEYFEKTGILLNYSLKGQHNEYLESQTGHFYDAEHSAYFVGIPKGGFKFSRGQFNHIRFLDGPDYLKQRCVELTATYYVRNKSATVLPFPFKTLSEYVEQQTRFVEK
ncbi:hypothetical protein [Pseudoalteromonas shioyasakiensis]|uniref:hypothetical protein n=1 Tax=Pseudoalteromonas shioyasakiensis TaxID=1190813 RepID=UPI0007806D92|nr:hypothetical protein [Pseudoalteromonas shioyasakiensis]